MGGDSQVTATEEYNGTSWTTSVSMATGRGRLGGAGTQTAGLGFGGYTTVRVNNTEEYTGGSVTTTASNLTTS